MAINFRAPGGGETAPGADAARYGKINEMEKTKRNNFIKLAGAIIACELAGVIGALYTTPNIGTWYAFLAKPAQTPPAWVFGPVWIIRFS